ncbi:MAG: hypothetical protein WC372_02485 [Candidatus Neomarinimicrobiota bacterium]|nr:hypothetical protein [Candidatus Neomarinimicrobiota bacterium]MDX9780233.1 hypothetical protein [bacterium]
MKNISKESGALLSWKVLMAKNNPARALSVAVIIFICSYFVFLTMKDVLLTVIALLVLLIMVLPYYLPVSYILTEEMIVKKMPFSRQQRRWEEFRRFDTAGNAIKLYTMSRASRLDNYRSFLIICKQNRDQVLEIVHRKIEVHPEGKDV